MLLASCNRQPTAEDLANDAAGDAAVDALVDSGIDERLSDLEMTVENQASEIEQLKADVANAQSTADDAYARVGY